MQLKVLLMKEKEQHLQQLTEIHEMMSKSSRFISLSGLSGIMAGLSAIAGAAAAYLYVQATPLVQMRDYVIDQNGLYISSTLLFLILDAIAILVVAVGAGIFFTTRNARKKGQSIWDAQVRRLLGNLMLPLGVGALFCAILLYHKIIFMIAPATLIFYGLALINASKYTLNDIRYLGIAEVVLGLVGAFFLGYGLLSWVIGFGVLHILYGGWMYMKYER